MCVTLIVSEWQSKEITLENGTDSKEKSSYFRLDWKVGGYRLNGLEKKDVLLLEGRKRDYMTGRGYPEDSGFVRATHRVEGKSSMLLVDQNRMG